MASDLFRGAIIRDCLIKNVVDGKTLKVLLNPLGWCPRPTGGWAARPTSVAAQYSANEPQKVSVHKKSERSAMANVRGYARTASSLLRLFAGCAPWVFVPLARLAHDYTRHPFVSNIGEASLFLFIIYILAQSGGSSPISFPFVP